MEKGRIKMCELRPRQYTAKCSGKPKFYNWGYHLFTFYFLILFFTDERKVIVLI